MFRLLLFLARLPNRRNAHAPGNYVIARGAFETKHSRTPVYFLIKRERILKKKITQFGIIVRVTNVGRSILTSAVRLMIPFEDES